MTALLAANKYTGLRETNGGMAKKNGEGRLANGGWGIGGIGGRVKIVCPLRHNARSI